MLLRLTHSSIPQHVFISHKTRLYFFFSFPHVVGFYFFYFFFYFYSMYLMLYFRHFVLGWYKSNDIFALLDFAIGYWNTSLSKCVYVIHHFNAHFLFYDFCWRLVNCCSFYIFDYRNDIRKKANLSNFFIQVQNGF